MGTLTSFTLKSRDVGGKAGRALGDALKVNTTLTSFTLETDDTLLAPEDMDDELCRVFGDALTGNYFLTQVELPFPSNDEITSIIQMTIQRNIELTVLWRDLALISQKSVHPAIGAVVDALTDLGFRRS